MKTTNWNFSQGSTPHFQGQISCEEAGNTIAVTYNDESGDNARLIAAAPSLLSALTTIESILTKWNDEGKYTNLIDHAQQAINKAIQP